MENTFLTGLEQTKKLIEEISSNKNIGVNSLKIERSMSTIKTVNVELGLSFYKDGIEPGTKIIEGSFASIELTDSEG